MPAANIETLFQFENALETAVKTILAAIPLTAYRQRDVDEVATPWAAIQLSGTRAERAAHLNGSVTWPDGFSGSLRVVIVTNRGQNAASHTTYVGKVRKAIYDLTNFTTGLLPYHKVWNAMETGTNPTVTADQNEDASEITFKLDWLIREDAWPT
jgi:hypothetical protein